MLLMVWLAVVTGVVVPNTDFSRVSLPSVDEDEFVAVDRMIQVTQEQLQLQQHLKAMMLEFEHQKEAFVQGNQTKSHVSLMVRNARDILSLITEQHWQVHFSQSYLDELNLFASIAGKSGIKRPS